MTAVSVVREGTVAKLVSKGIDLNLGVIVTVGTVVTVVTVVKQ